MKTLHFLLSAERTLLADKLTSYLIEAGHVVQCVAPSDTAPHPEQYDYLIEIDPLPQRPTLPTIKFVAPELKNNQLAVSIVLEKDHHLFSFSTADFGFRENDLNDLYNAVLENFIDAIISLARDDETCWTPVQSLPEPSLFDELMLTCTEF